MTDPSTHSLTHIQLVAAGLMRVADTATAGAQLERIYGPTRTRTALRLLAGASVRDRRATSHVDPEVEVVIDLTDQALRRTAAPPPALRHRPRTSTPGGRRGRRPADWL